MGKVLYIIELSPYNINFKEKTSDEIKKTIESEISLVLSLMPRGATHVSSEQGNVLSLSIPFVLTFEHPLFEDGTRFEFDMERACHKIDDRIEQYTVLSGFRYIKPDGNFKYKRT